MCYSTYRARTHISTYIDTKNFVCVKLTGFDEILVYTKLYLWRYTDTGVGIGTPLLI